MDTLTKYPAKREGEGSIRASVRRLHKEEPAALARKIMSIYVDVACAARGAVRLAPGPEGTRQKSCRLK